MWAVIRELLSYVVFLVLLYFTTYSNGNPHGFYQVDHLQKYFLTNSNGNFLDIRTIDEYWSWLNGSFVSNLRAQRWYNNDPPRNLSGYLNDKTVRLLGWPILRQLRVRADSCASTRLVAECFDEFSWANEEKTSFAPNETLDAFVRRAFDFRSGDELDTYMYVAPHHTYPSSGFVYEFRGRMAQIRSNLSELQRLSWIDRETRAIFLQFSLYNPNVELFVAATLLVELLPTGGVFPHFRFEPISFVVFTSLAQLICAIFYLLFVVDLLVVQIRSLIELKWKFFRSFWSIVDVGLIVCSWMGVAVYVYRSVESKRLARRFSETNGYVFLNLQFATYMNDFFTYLLGYCCFFASLKFLRLCRFHPRLCLFSATVRSARGELLQFSLMFVFVFMAFLSLFYLLFLDRLSACSSLLHTAQMLFEMMLMKFDANELQGAAAFLGPFCFTVFVLVVIFVCLSMFVTIINEHFRSVRQRAENEVNEDQQTLRYMFDRLRCALGLKKRATFDEQTRSTYRHAVESFPEKIDQFLLALDRVSSSLLRVSSTFVRLSLSALQIEMNAAFSFFNK